MDLKIIYIIVFISLIGSVSYCQTPIFRDTFKKSTRVSANGELKIIYTEITNPNDLPKPLDKRKDMPELVNFRINSVEKLAHIGKEIFNQEEIVKLIESSMILDCKVLLSGKVVSASFLFSEKDPHICMKKLIQFSKEIKEKLTVTPIFSEKIDKEGYVQCYIFAYEEL